LGYGAIGRQVARVCTAMGMSVHAYTLHPRDTPASKRDRSYTPPGLGDVDGALPSKWFSGGSTEELHEFLGCGLDLVVVALPLTPSTTGLISKAEFEVLGRNKTFLSNVARGPIVDTDALYDALEKDVIRGAAIDVTDPEPLTDDHKLWTAKNIIITPHVSGNSTAYAFRVFEILKINLRNLIEGRDLMNKVNRKDGY
jgi:phosphoglycerate dehydrogenase-like enzyme